MNESVFLLQMFSEYQPPEELREVLSQAAICDADIDPQKRVIYVRLNAPKYISAKKIAQAEKEIATCYQLKKMQISVRYPVSEATNMDPEDLMSLFTEQNSMTRGSLAGAGWQWEDQQLRVYVCCCLVT